LKKKQNDDIINKGNFMIDINEELFTDYAIEMISAYLSNDMLVFFKLIDSYSEKEYSNKAFMPGILFAMIVHVSSLLNHIAEASNQTMEKTFKDYALSYNMAREDLITHDMLSPKKAEEFFNLLAKNGENL